MAGTLRGRSRRNIDENFDNSTENLPKIEALSIDNPTSDIEIYAKEVLHSLIADNLPPTPNNFSLYFDRFLEEKNKKFRQQIHSILELEESDESESTIKLERTLKEGFDSVKSILGVTANLYKNMALMSKILSKRREELVDSQESREALSILDTLEKDLGKLSAILKTESLQMKTHYAATADIIKNVENETIFDNQFGVYNKRYLMTKIEKEISLVKEFHNSSSLIMIELSQELKTSIKNEKAIQLMTKAIARLLLKTSRRSDIVAHYGNGVFAMLLKHTDIESAKKASERLIELVSNSNFFLADREIQLKISIGVTNITVDSSVEEIIVSALDGMEKTYNDPKVDLVVSLKE